MLTATGQPEGRIAGLDSGTDRYYLMKPFEPRELLLLINRILNRGPIGGVAQPAGGAVEQAEGGVFGKGLRPPAPPSDVTARCGSRPAQECDQAAHERPRRRWR